MKSLATLIKLQKSFVDEQRLLLANLRAQLERIEEDIRALAREKEEQKKLLDSRPEMGLTYGQYIKAATEKGEALEKRRRAAEIAVDLAHEKLSELFEGQKRYEIAEENRIKAERKEEERKERIVLDEVGSVTFVRKKKKR